MFLGQIYSFLKQILQLPHFFFPQKLRISGSHKSTLSCYRMKQPCMFQFVVGPLCCNNADTQFPGEYADGRQRIALFERSRQDLAFDLRHDLLIDWLVAGIADIELQSGCLLSLYVYTVYKYYIQIYTVVNKKMFFVAFLYIFYYNNH